MTFSPSLQAFRDEAAAGARILPVWREIVCDAETPVAIYGKLRAVDPLSFLLESAVGGVRWGRYSFVGVGARARVVGGLGPHGLTLEVESVGELGVPASLQAAAAAGDLGRLVRELSGPAVEALPRFWGGLVGVWGHDVVRSIERLPLPPGRVGDGLPVIEALLTDTIVVLDGLSQRATIVAAACPEADGGPETAYRRACERIERIRAALAGPPATLAPLSSDPSEPIEPHPTPPWTRAGYLASVERGKAYIREGDVFQVVLSQRFDRPRDGIDALSIYRALRVGNPAPYMYCLALPSATLVGASPEVLVRVDRGARAVTVRPIAGTAPRGATEAEDLELERRLLSDVKERAEHLMLIDLGRNDVGRVSVPGTVRMAESFAIERYSRVMHIVSEVTGELRPELDAWDAVRATFPAGTLSGAPKIRALQIIDELEPASRGWYGGAVGYLGYDGGADFAICIRSVVATDHELRVQVGAGIVHDSDPELEDRECRHKVSAVLRAIEWARASGGGRS